MTSLESEAGRAITVPEAAAVVEAELRGLLA